MSSGWLKPSKRRLKRQLSISQPRNFQHVEHIGHDDVLTNSKQLSTSFQNIAELCSALGRRKSASDHSTPSPSPRLSEPISDADLFNEITDCLAPDLRSFLITDPPEDNGEKILTPEVTVVCRASSDSDIRISHKTSSERLITSIPPISPGPEKPSRKKPLAKVVNSNEQHGHELISDVKTSSKSQMYLAPDKAVSYNKENVHQDNLPPPITPRTAKKLKLKDDLFKDMIAKYCSAEDPSKRLKELRKLGQGSSGVVFLVKDTVTDTELALKKMNLHRQQRRDLLVNEVSVGSLQHPNIVKTFSTHLVKDELWVLMEPLKAGSLTFLVENLALAKLTEGHIARIAHCTVSALQYMHTRGVVHRDVKSDSILLSPSGQVKLSDFGYCDRITEEKPTCTGLIGTPHWMSPEIVARKPYGTPTDIWSLGILLIEMLDGEPPNFGDSQIVAMEKVKVNPAPSPVKSDVSTELLSFLTSCLKIEPLLRSTAPDLLKHKLLSVMTSQSQLAQLINNFLSQSNSTLTISPVA